jgi:replicative DNA helicase
MSAQPSPVPPRPIDEVAALRVPPHSVEAEQSVLGAVLLDNTAWEKIGDVLREEDFYRHDHRLIWQHMSKLLERNQPADVLTLQDALRSTGKLDEAAAWLPERARQRHAVGRQRPPLRRDRPRPRGAAAPDLGVRRDRDHRAEPAGARHPADPRRGRVEGLPDLRGRLARARRLPGPAVGAAQVVERVDDLYNRENPNDITGVPTGFVDLDRMTSGMQPGDLIILAARPSVGKTAFALNIASTSRSTRACRWRCSRWRWAPRSSRCAWSARSAASTSSGCAPAG